MEHNEIKTTNFDEYLELKLQDKEIKKAYDELESNYILIRKLIEVRKRKNITQKQLAMITRINQAEISKLETGNSNPTINYLKRIADALDMNLKIDFIPKTK